MGKLLLLAMAVMLVGCGGDGTDGTMECDYCKEDIKQRALVCKHCGGKNSYGIMRAESERESEMSDRQRVIYQAKKDNLEKYKSRERSKSDYEFGKAWWSPGGEGFQTLMDSPDYDSDGNLKKEAAAVEIDPDSWEVKGTPDWVGSLFWVVPVVIVVIVVIVGGIGFSKEQAQVTADAERIRQEHNLRFGTQQSNPTGAESDQTAKYADGIFTVNCPHCSTEVAVDESQLEHINTQLYGFFACPIESCGEAIEFPNAEEAADLKAPTASSAPELAVEVGAKKPVNAPAPPPQTNPAAKPTIVRAQEGWYFKCKACGKEFNSKEEEINHQTNTRPGSCAWFVGLDN